MAFLFFWFAFFFSPLTAFVVKCLIREGAPPPPSLYAKWTFIPFALWGDGVVSLRCLGEDVAQRNGWPWKSRVNRKESGRCITEAWPEEFLCTSGGRGRGQQLASFNAQRAGIVEIYRGCCCRSKLLRCAQEARLRVFGCVVQFPTVGERRKTGVVERTRAKDGIMWRKERKGGGTGLACGCRKTFSTLRFTRQLNILCIAAL